MVPINCLFVCVFFRARFHPQYSEKDAARAMIEVVEAACLNFRYCILLAIVNETSIFTNLQDILI